MFMKSNAYSEVELETMDLSDENLQAFCLANNITIDDLGNDVVNYSGKWIDLVAMIKNFWGEDELASFIFDTQG